MSFRVWFLRMVWIVAAAVALSGCDNDDKEDENGGGNGGGNGDGPSLAVTLDKASADVDTTTATAAHDVKVTVAITSDDDADKKAKVTLTVTCDPDTVEVTAPDAKDAADGSVTWDEVSVPLGVAAKCTFKAEAELGGEKKHNSAMFEVKAASGSDAPAVTSVKFYSEAALSTELTGNAADATLAESAVAGTHVEVMTDKDVDDAADISLSWACVNNSDDASIATSSTDITVAMVGSDKKKFSAAIGNVLDSHLDNTHTPAKCTFSAKVGEDGTPVTGDLYITGA